MFSHHSSVDYEQRQSTTSFDRSRLGTKSAGRDVRRARFTLADGRCCRIVACAFWNSLTDPSLRSRYLACAYSASSDDIRANNSTRLETETRSDNTLPGGYVYGERVLLHLPFQLRSPRAHRAQLNNKHIRPCTVHSYSPGAPYRGPESSVFEFSAFCMACVFSS